jgi:Lar family restriction alleviation protein
MKEELKPCPFCDSEGILKSIITDYNETHYFVFCRCCAAKGGWDFNKKGAIKLWNTRHSQWISVEDRLPEINQYVDIFIGNVELLEEDFFGKHFYDETTDTVYYLTEVTHWMPKPQPPKEER